VLDHIDHLLCRTCGSTFRPSVRSLCPQCVDGGELRYVYDLSRVALDAVKLSRRESWLWRFKELLPFDEAVELPPLQVGMTPLYGSPRLAAYAGLGGLIVKDESRNPTGRLGDRAAALLVAFARDRSQAVVSRRLARSVASFAASAGIPSMALVAAATRSEDEAAPLKGWGMHILQGRSFSRAELVRLGAASGALVADLPSALVNEGLKTLGLEIGEQLAERLPEWVIIDGAEEGLPEAVLEGLAQLKDVGMIRTVPRLVIANGHTDASEHIEGRGALRVEVTAAEAAQASLEIRRALGLPIDADGAVPLAAARSAREAGLIPSSAVALIVVQGGPHPSTGVSAELPLVWSW